MGIENIDYVTCKICNEQVQILKRHLKKHNISWKYYLLIFPKSIPTPESYRKRMSIVRSGSRNGMFGSQRIGLLNPFFGKTHTVESKEKISSGRKGKYKGEDHWLYKKGYLISGDKNPNHGSNENLKGEKNPFYGKTHTKETIDMLKNDDRCVTLGFKGHHHITTNKQILSKKATTRMKHLWSITGHHNNIFFHSSYECIFLEICKKLNIEVERAYKFRTAYYHNGKRRWYNPDFYLSEFQLIVEIKGYETSIDRKKESTFRKKFVNISFIKLYKDDLKNLVELLEIDEDIKNYKGVKFFNESKVNKKNKFW